VSNSLSRKESKFRYTSSFEKGRTDILTSVSGKVISSSQGAEKNQSTGTAVLTGNCMSKEHFQPIRLRREERASFGLFQASDEFVLLRKESQQMRKKKKKHFIMHRKGGEEKDYFRRHNTWKYGGRKGELCPKEGSLKELLAGKKSPGERGKMGRTNRLYFKQKHFSGKTKKKEIELLTGRERKKVTSSPGGRVQDQRFHNDYEKGKGGGGKKKIFLNVHEKIEERTIISSSFRRGNPTICSGYGIGKGEGFFSL